MLTNRTTRRGERGQVLMFTGLSFVFVLLGLVAAVGDLLVLSNESAKARDAAFLGAQAGGSDVDLTSVANRDLLTSADLTLSVAPASTDCQQAAAIADPGISVTCTITGGRVTAAVSRNVQLPIQLFGASVTVRATAQGGPAVGTVTAQ